MKKFANKGVARNKKPLKNIVYEIKISQLKEETNDFEKYKFKELGYLTLTWWYESKTPVKNWHGFIEPQNLKTLLGDKQWSKFCQGKTTFIIQRRIDGKNI